MSNLFDLARQTPALATELIVPFPFKYSKNGFAIVASEDVPIVDDTGKEAVNKDGEVILRKRFKDADVELYLTVSSIPSQQFKEAETNVKIDCDKANVPLSYYDKTLKREVSSAYAKELLAAEKVRVLLEHVEDWQHKPKEGEPQEFSEELLKRLIEQVRLNVGAQTTNELLMLSYTMALVDESQKAVTARMNGRPTSGEGLENLAFAV